MKLALDTGTAKATLVTAGILLGLGNGEYNAGERRFQEGEGWWKAQAAGLTVDNIVDLGGALKGAGNGISSGFDKLQDVFTDEGDPQTQTPPTLPEASAQALAISLPDRAAVAVVSFTVEH